MFVTENVKRREPRSPGLVKTMVWRNPYRHRAKRIDKLGSRGADREPGKWDLKVQDHTGLMYKDLRYRVFLARHHGMSTSAAAARFGVSKGFVSKWYNIGSLSYGLKGKIMNSFLSLPMGFLKGSCPVQDAIMEDVIRLRARHPWMGSCKIKVIAGLNVSTRTIDKAIKKAGFTKRTVKRKRRTYIRFERMHSLSLVQLDYKKWDDGSWSVWALDDHSRMILGMEVTRKADTDSVIRLMDGVVKRFGTPEQILTDHGAQFTYTRDDYAFHRFGAWCKEHGIEHVMGRLASPETQGKIERSHLSAIRETEHLGKIRSAEERRKVLMDWMEFYNTERPHQSLDYDVPVNVFLRDLKNQDMLLNAGVHEVDA